LRDNKSLLTAGFCCLTIHLSYNQNPKFFNNEALTGLKGFKNVTFVGGSLQISGMPTLSNLNWGSVVILSRLIPKLMCWKLSTQISSDNLRSKKDIEKGMMYYLYCLLFFFPQKCLS